MVAYLSINHLGYCMLGLFRRHRGDGAAFGRNADSLKRRLYANLQSWHHRRRAVLLLSGYSSNDGGLRGIDDFGGLMQTRPAPLRLDERGECFSSLGLPGLNGFIGEFLIFKGSFAICRFFLPRWRFFGLLFTAIVFMRAIQSLFQRPARRKRCRFFCRAQA